MRRGVPDRNAKGTLVESLMSDIWYYSDHNGQVGPLSLHDLKETLSTLAEPQSISVWSARFPDWRLAKDVPELNNHSETPSTPGPRGPAAIGLTKCPDCGHDVSPSASACPNCGSPIKEKLDRKKANWGCLLLLLPFVVIGFLVFAWHQGLTPEQKAALDKKHQDEDMSVESCTFVQKIVRAHLKAPATAEFPNCYGAGLNEYYIRANSARDTFVVEGYVDAQNGFGAKIRTRFEATISRSGPTENIILREVKFSFK
jgi:uncharacterized protein DUF4339/zinc ribbon protein